MKPVREFPKIDPGALLRKLSGICLALPEAVRKDLGEHADFRVRKKVFAYFLNNHHGDQIVSVCYKAEMGEDVDRASREPQRFYLPAYIGPRGWFGLRLDGPTVDWSEVENLVQFWHESWIEQQRHSGARPAGHRFRYASRIGRTPPTEGVIS